MEIKCFYDVMQKYIDLVINCFLICTNLGISKKSQQETYLMKMKCFLVFRLYKDYVLKRYKRRAFEFERLGSNQSKKIYICS